SDSLAATVWDGRSGHRLTVVKASDGGILGSAFSPDGSRFATIAVNRVQIWDTQSGRQVAANDEFGYLNSVAYAPDGRTVVVTDDGGVASIVDARTGAVRERLSGARERLVRAVFSPDGHFIAAAGEDGTARIWTVGGRRVDVLVHDGPVRDVEFSPDGSRVVTASDDGTAGVWQVSSGIEGAALRGHAERVNRAIFTPDGSHVITASNDGTVRVWDVDTANKSLEPADDLQLTAANAPNSTTGTPSRPAFTPDWRLFATAVGPETRVVEARSGRTVATLRDRGRISTGAAFSADGRRLLVIYDDGHARVWRVGSWTKQALVRGSGYDAFGSLSPTGDKAVTASNDDPVVRVWDARDGSLLAELHGHKRTDLDA